MDMRRRWFVINRGEQWQESFFEGLVIEGDAVAISPGAFHGCAYLSSIDSAERDFTWGRLVIDAHLPEGTLLRVSHYVSNSKELNDEEPDLDKYLKDPSVSPRRKAASLDMLYGDSINGAQDMLLIESGRYLWLKLELYATSESRPKVNALKLELSGDHMMDYMPGAYRRTDTSGFLLRYLSIFNSLVTDVEARIDHIAQSFDYELCDEEMLRFLAEWICVDDTELKGEALRVEIGGAFNRYENMYTHDAIKRQIFGWTGFMPTIIEHFHVSGGLSRSRDCELYRRLYGENPNKFFVLLDEKAFLSKRDADAFLSRLRGKIPAHIEVDLVLLKPNIHLDFHTYLGINSVIGGYAPMAIDDMAALQHDTIIGGIS